MGVRRVATNWLRTLTTRASGTHSWHSKLQKKQGVGLLSTETDVPCLPSHGGNTGWNPVGVTVVKPPVKPGVFVFGWAPMPAYPLGNDMGYSHDDH